MAKTLPSLALAECLKCGYFKQTLVAISISSSQFLKDEALMKPAEQNNIAAQKAKRSFVSPLSPRILCNRSGYVAMSRANRTRPCRGHARPWTNGAMSTAPSRSRARAAAPARDGTPMRCPTCVSRCGDTPTPRSARRPSRNRPRPG